jgi:lipopolysaccharide transport system permease protein
MHATQAPPLPPAAARSRILDDLAEMTAELVRGRELLWQMALRDLRVRYKQAALGYTWAVVVPLMVVAAGVVLRYAAAQMAGKPVDLGGIAGMAVKAVGWSFFAGAVGFAVPSLVNNRNLVTKIYFPREVFPLSAVLTQAVDAAVASAVVLLGLLVCGVLPTAAWLWVPVLVLLLVAQMAGLSLMLSCANLFFRDVRYLTQTALTFGIFFTPVFFEASSFGPRGATLLMLNPLSPLLEGLRLALVEQHSLAVPLVAANPSGVEVTVWHPWMLAYAAAWALGGGLAGWWVFHRCESAYAEYA